MTAGTLFIEVQGTRYGLKFGYAALRQLGVLLKLNDLQEVFSRLGKLGELANGKLNFESLDLIGDIALASILASDSQATLSREDLITHFLAHNDDMMQVINQFVASMPQAATSKQPAPKKKKTTRNKK